MTKVMNRLEHRTGKHKKRLNAIEKYHKEMDRGKKIMDVIFSKDEEPIKKEKT